MNVRRTSVCLGLAAAVFASLAKAAECNVWPFYVGQTDANGQRQSWQAAGPLFFEKSLGEDGTASGFRPIYLLRQDAAGVKRETDYAAVTLPLAPGSANPTMLPTGPSLTNTRRSESSPSCAASRFKSVAPAR